MKINSIQIKVASLIILILTISITSVLIFITNNQKSELIKSTVRTLSVNTSILNTSIKNIMISGEAPIATKTVQELKGLPALTEVSIYRVDGSTAFSDYETIDKVNNYQDYKVFDKTERLDSSMISNQNFITVLKTKTPKQNELPLTKELEYFFPILNYKECRSCHGTENFIRGVVHFKISIKGIYDTISNSRKVTTLLFVFIGILITFLLYISLKRVVLKPLSSISLVVKKVTKGNLEDRVDLKNKDELGVLGDSINSMIIGLEERNSLLITNKVIEAQNKENKKYLDNIQEGLVLLDKDYKISPIYSKFFTKLFKIENPEGLFIQDIIYKNSDSTEFTDFLDMVKNNLYADMEMLMDINPVDNIRITLDNDTEIIIDAFFARVFNEKDEVENIMVIFKDKTKIVLAENELENEKKRSQSELEIISSMLRTGKEDFLSILEDLNKTIELIKNDINQNTRNNKRTILSELHTIKGVANYLGFNQFADTVHKCETIINTESSNSFTETLNDLKNELVIMETVYEQFENFIGTTKADNSFENFLTTLPNTVGELAGKLDKEIVLEIKNSIDIFPNFNKLKGALLHLIRNSIDHGIEDRFKRLERKKESEGKIKLILEQDDSIYKITIEDDGNGFDFDAIQKKALELGITKKENLPHSELIKILFLPNFSSKESVSEISGRGYGLDAVKATVDKLGGSISIRNRAENGTTFIIIIPKGD